MPKDDKWISHEEAIKALEKEFVTFEIAEKLKELGFDEPCFGFYSNQIAGKKSYLIIGNIVKMQDHYHGQICSAPLCQQAINWLKAKQGDNEDQYKSFDETLTRILKIEKQ